MTLNHRPSPIHRFIRFFLWVMVSLFLSLSVIETVGAENRIIDRIVAVVNDEIIVFQDLNKVLQPMAENLSRSGQSPEKIREFLYDKRKQLLDLLIDQKLIIQDSKKYGVSVEEKEIDSAIERMKTSNRLTDEALREMLKSQGTTMAEFRASFREQILINRMEQIEVKSKIVITQEDIKAYYEAHRDQYKGNSQYHLRHLMIAAPQFGTDADRAAAKAKIEEAQAALSAGESFVDAVKRYADPQYAQDGGELGLFSLEDLSPRLKSEVQKLSAGKTTPIIASDQGFQIIYLEEMKETSAVALEKASKEIEDKLFKDTFSKKKQEWLEGLRKRAHIKIIN